MNLLFLDFEFRSTREPSLDVVSVALEAYSRGESVLSKSYWLKDPYERAAFVKLYLALTATYTPVSFVLQAEARCLFDLIPTLTPRSLRGICLYLNYRLLLNHNDPLEYGKQLINGVVKNTKKPKPKFERTEEDLLSDSTKPQFSLASATYKLLDIKIDTEEKTRVRDILIRGTDAEVDSAKQEILAYGQSDVKYLKQLYDAELEACREFAGLTDREAHKVWFAMGEYAARSAWMERLGYPVASSEVRGFVSHIPEILTLAAERVNESSDVKAFLKNEKTGLYVKKEDVIRGWIDANCDVDLWLKTDKGKTSLSLDAFKKFFSSESPGFGGAMVSYLKTKQSLNGFTPSKTKRGSFFDYLGSDQRVRPYFGIYGSQSSRSQPSATGFLPLKAHWMRYFIYAKPGRAITGVDYASQEFLIAALLSGDRRMVEAYDSGDVYLAFGKSSGLIPASGTKSTHEKERNICKTLVLGISYDMSAVGLSSRLTQITGSTWTERMASELIEKFYDIYSDYAEWKRQVQYEYESVGSLQLKDGWMMLGDNENSRSVGNFPVQGAGAAIMRKAVALAQDVGIDVIYTLHDALYAEHDAYIKDCGLADCMKKAFMWHFDNRKGSELIRLDSHTWGRGLKEGRYIDAKGKKDLEIYQKFFS